MSPHPPNPRYLTARQVWVVAEAEPVSRLSDTFLRLLPVGCATGALLVDGLLYDRLLVISGEVGTVLVGPVNSRHITCEFYLLKFVTMIGMGKVMQRTPQMAQSDAMNFPPDVFGATSP